jgi:ketosteroid isomerase-like protein
MAPKALDLVRSIYVGWARGDFRSVEWAHQQIEFEFADGPEPGRWQGVDEMSAHYADWLRGWRDFRAEPERYFAPDERCVLVFVRNTARGRASGLELDMRSVANYFEVDDGKVVRLALYWDRDRALADAGIARD